MSILAHYTPDMEVYSIDEAFLKFSGFDYVHLREHGESMRQKVLKWTGIPISVGIADSRHVPLMEAVDKLNAQFGQQKIRLASQDQKRVWKMRQERLSPRYTTELDDVILVDLSG